MVLENSILAEEVNLVFFQCVLVNMDILTVLRVLEGIRSFCFFLFSNEFLQRNGKTTLYSEFFFFLPVLPLGAGARPPRDSGLR